jgi:hypothetical protein
MIDRYFPTLPKIELHARAVAARPGWDVWGPEAVMPEKPHTLESPTKDQGELEVGADFLSIGRMAGESGKGLLSE